MSDQYGLPDFRRFMAGTTQYFPPAITHPTEPPFFLHRNVVPPVLHCEPAMVVADQVLPRGQLVGFGHDSTDISAPTAAAATTTTTLCGSPMESPWMGYDGGNTRWPRQETLTLLEIRSRLDSKFKETNQKGPLWDEVSRIMAEEHGHQRSGKKCKEKFENLYKYYKKTKEGKAGRQGGKHYRFFRQLEAIYGEASNSTINHLPYNQNQEVVSFTNSSEFETSSSENNDDHHHHHDLSAIALMMNKGIKKKSWKGKVEEFVDSQMRKIIDTQEAWMERMLRTIENREQERVFKEEEWRRQEAARFDQEVHELWAKERAWVEARDAALMEALKKFVGKGLENDNKRWSELEISSLISLRTSLELRFQEGGYLEEGLWEEIAAKMASLGHDRSALDYKEKWENISIYYGQGIPKQRLMVEGLLPSSSFNYSLNEGENVWENYGVKLNKGKNQQV